MKYFRSISWMLFVVLIARSATGDDANVIKQQLLLQPPTKLVQEVQRLTERGLSSGPMNVDYLRADLDGSGQFRFLIAAFYLGDSPAGCCVYLRVFSQQDGTLRLVGEQEDQHLHGSYGLRINLIDINGDGIPELELEGTDMSGQLVFDEYLGWTGSSLHELLGSDVAAVNAGLEDIDGDGTLELIIPAGDNKWDGYKYNGTEFTFWQSFDYDPLGMVGKDGAFHLIRPFLVDLRPATFALASIQSSSPSEQGTVKLVLGDLRDLKGNAIAPDQVDPGSIFLGRDLRPTSVNIRPATSEDLKADHGAKASLGSPVLEVSFARADILKWLPKLKLTAPLTKGDQLELKARAKLKDGTRVSTVTTATIQ